MAFAFQFIGILMLMLAATKLITVFGSVEGTYLRQKLMLALGCGDLVFAALVFRYDGLPRSATGGFMLMLALEGAAFVADAVLRPRKEKSKRK